MSMSGVLSVLHEQVRCPTCYTWADQVSHLLYMSRSGVPPVVHARVMYPSCYIWAGQVSHLLYMSWSGVSPVIHEQVRCLTCCTMYNCTWAVQVSHLLYMSRSGVQMTLGGILTSCTLPYSEAFQRMLASDHSCNTTTTITTQLQHKSFSLSTVKCWAILPGERK